MTEIARVLKEQGHVIITTPYNENVKKSSVICPECGHEFHRFGHLQSFNEKKFENLLTRDGFKVRSMKIYALGQCQKSLWEGI